MGVGLGVCVRVSPSQADSQPAQPRKPLHLRPGTHSAGTCAARLLPESESRPGHILQPVLRGTNKLPPLLMGQQRVQW